jgi:hypothetical protein
MCGFLRPRAWSRQLNPSKRTPLQVQRCMIKPRGRPCLPSRHAQRSSAHHQEAAFEPSVLPRERLASRARTLGKAREWDEAPALDPKPPAPMRRADVADIGDAGIGFLALQRVRRRRHAPARHGEFAAIGLVANDGRSVVGIDAWERRHVARPIAHGSRQLPDRLLAFGDRVEIAHGASPRWRCRRMPPMREMPLLALITRSDKGVTIRESVSSEPNGGA